MFVKKHSKYEIMAPPENMDGPSNKKWPNIFSNSGAIVPAPSFAFLGTENHSPFAAVWKVLTNIEVCQKRSNFKVKVTR